VPKYFGKKMLPLSMLAYIFNISFISWVYTKLSIRKNNKLRKFKYHTLPNIVDFLKATIFLYWLVLIVFGILKIFFRFIKFIFTPFFGNRSASGFNRYLGLARHATYKNQEEIFKVLKKSYPDNYSFVVLAMDMEFMRAGKPKLDYYSQLDELVKIKESQSNRDKILPFIAVDPRRISNPKKNNFSFEGFAIDKLKNKIFDGIKLYPALGFYPFDTRFKNMYQFCVNNEIPITTHCIEGTVYYRGKKKKEWASHPIYKINKNKKRIYLPLPEKDNHDFTKNFTHPLNYECLLNPEMASEWFDDNIDFSKLKICLAHFGGSEEWDKYFEDIYNSYNNSLFETEDTINRKTLTGTNLDRVWNDASWLSIIYDLMCKYENVYADMSFMLYNEKNFDLLKLLIDDEVVGGKILFGTDFYVVAQKGTEKRLYHTIRANLGENRFNKVAVKNARTFLSSKLHTV